MSFNRGLNFHHETNANSQPTINNNISISSTNELKATNPAVTIESNESSGKIVYPPPEKQEPTQIERENEFLKTVLNLYMNQQVYWSGKFIVLKPEELLKLIKILLPNTQLKLFTNEVEVSCCGVNKEAPFAKIDSIWYDDEDGTQLNLKYTHSEIIGLLEQYRISIKFVRD